MDKVNVDIDALYSLKGAINRAAGSLIDVGESIDSYFHDTIGRLERTVAYFQEKLNQAQRELDKACEELYKAEDAYNNCISSQREKRDEDGNIYYVPSCSIQAGRVSLCRRIVQQAERVRDEWKRKVDEAERIKYDCQREIDRYNDPGGLTHSPGGKGILMNLANEHSKEACSKLDETINAVNDILSFSFVTGESSTSTSEYMDEMQNNEYKKEVDESIYEKFEAGKKRIEESINNQYNDTAQPNIYEICPLCKRFKYLNCICGRNQNER